MATTLLIVGYVLAAGPLLFLRKMWRGRWWWAYGSEVLGALAIAAGWALKLELWAVGISVAWALGFGLCFPLYAGRGKRWWVVLSTGLVTVLVLGAVGYGVIRLRFRKTRVSRVSTGQVISEYREKVAASHKRDTGRTPPPGVYEYAARGHYVVTATGLGTDRRVMPKTVPAVVTAKGDCWVLAVRYFKQHHWSVRYCKDPKVGLRLKWLRNANNFFGLESIAWSVCDPDVLVRAGGKPPGQWPQKCRPKSPSRLFGSAKGTGLVRSLGVETLQLGKQTVTVHHVHRTVEITSLQTAKTEQHMYYAKSGMLVRLRVKSSGKGLATFVADFEIKLLSLSPKR